ncbi:hypothetical protein EG329_002126 [Mollisiaceae sp. DMI_Dod_QoI]|nr:hypothetical protein EG329_002126 [Helotiales sp. DMI_Dod_QoI]
MMSEPKTNVPKFASFRPKPTQQQLETQLKDRDQDRHSSRGRSEKERKSGHHKQHRSRSRESKHAPSRDVEVSRGTPVAAPDIFIVDRKGDVKNLVYGSIHRYSVPPFHRYGAGYVLGASPDLKIDRDLDDGKEVVLRSWKASKSSRREKYVFARVEKEKPRLLRLRPEVVAEVHHDAYADFVPLQSTRGRKRKRGENGEGESSDSEQDARDYRSIYGKGKGHDQPEDPDLQYVTESDSSGSDAGRAIKLDTSIRERNVKLSRKVDEFPHDIDAWLELIDHQDELIRAGDDRRRVTTAEITSTADIKIHMYEKALEKTRSLKNRERLLQGLMTEGAKIWELKVQANRWEQIAKENIDSLLLWTSYLNFKQSTFSTFRYEEIKELYINRIKLLLATINKSGTDSTDSLYQQILYVLLRFTLFVRESGYSELSVAIWQSLLELNLCAPNQQLSNEESSKLFQQFWESEVPRLGEDGALGWRQYVDNEDSSDVPDPITDEADVSLQRSNIFKAWATAERQRSKFSRMPARTMDEVVEDDPFRVILFSDIEDLLILLPFKLHTSCIDAFLLFCRSPSMVSEDHESRRWSMDQLVRNNPLDWDSAKLQQELYTKEQDYGEDTGLNPSFKVMLPSLRASPESLCAGSPSLQMTSWQNQYAGDNGPVPYLFLRNALKQLTQANFTEDLAYYHMAFEYVNEPETIKKVAKGLLKQHPSSLKLYNMYALIEWSRGNKEVAKAVFSAALGLILLTYLTSTSTKETTSTTQGDITTALSTLTSFSTTLQLRNYKTHQELLLQSGARLLLHHSNNGPYRPSLIRTQLTNFLTLFPQNTLFLSLFTANESLLRVENRVRSLFLSTILTPEHDCLTSRVFAIQYELYFGTIHSVRSAFEKAVSSPVCKSSPGLWRFYFLWMVENEKLLVGGAKGKGRGKGMAKDIWYRALRACPWAKELYVLGFEVFGESEEVGFGELRGTWRVMGEKELRVRVDVEEELDDMDEREGKRREVGQA